MTIWHGTRLYAVHSRDVGTFGGRAKRATIKIYDGSCANSPRATLSEMELVRQMRADLTGIAKDRPGINDYLRRFLPATDPYRTEH